MSTPKIPKQFRVTLKQQFNYEYRETEELSDGGNPIYEHITTELTPLGFANVYDPHTKTYAKRQETQDDWAYCGNWNGHHEVRDGKYWKISWTWQRKVGLDAEEAKAAGQDGFEKIYTEELFEDRFQPIIIDNEPLEGFRIQHMVARHRGNKLWRILDPRGFELEIGSGNFEDLVMSGVVDRGLIVGKCVWKTAKMLQRVE